MGRARRDTCAQLFCLWGKREEGEGEERREERVGKEKEKVSGGAKKNEKDFYLFLTFGPFFFEFFLIFFLFISFSFPLGGGGREG